MAKTKPTGRPCEYTSEIDKTICQKLGEGMSMVEICKADDMPSRSTVHNWLLRGEADQKANVESDFSRFLDTYVRARELQAERYFEETLSIADALPQDGYWEASDGKRYTDREYSAFTREDKELLNAYWFGLTPEKINLAKLRIEARKWHLSKLLPKKYGDKLDVTSGGEKIKGTVVVATQAEKDLLDSI